MLGSENQRKTKRMDESYNPYASEAGPAFIEATENPKANSRERYLQEGPKDFGPAELLALILGSSANQGAALTLAGALLDHFGGLAEIANREPQELQSVPGVGAALAVRLHAAIEAGRRATRVHHLPAEPITSPERAFEALSPGFRGLKEEQLHALFLDRARLPIARRTLTHGSASFTVVDPKQIYRLALALDAYGVILAHNHPSGCAEPSRMDRDVTNRVARAGQAVGIPLLDHLVIAGDRFHALAEDGPLITF